MISTIQFHNVKGRSGSFDLEPLTVITGRNAAGKTTVLDALKIGLLGYHPTLGKRPADTFQLASDTKMGVTVEFTHSGDTSTVTRTWTQKGKSVKTTTEVAAGKVWAPGDEALLKHAEQTGAGLDVGRFLHGTSRERIALLAAVGGEAANALRDRAATFLGRADGDWSDPFKRAEELAEELKQACSDARTEVARWTKTVEGLSISDAEAGASTFDSEALRKAEKELAVKRTALGAANEAASALERMETEANEAQARLEAMDLSPEDAAIEARYETAVGAREAAQRTHHEAQKAEIEAHRTLEELRPRVEKAETLLNVWREHSMFLEDGKISTALIAAEIDALEAEELPDVETLTEACDALRKAYGEASNVSVAAQAAEDEAEKAFAGFEALECCPTCQAAAEGWKDAVLNTLTLKRGSAAAARVSAAAALKLASESLAMADKALMDAKATAERIKQLPALQNALSAAMELPRLRLQLEELEARAEAATEARERAAHAAEDAASDVTAIWERKRQLAGVEALRAAASKRVPQADIDAATDRVVNLEDAVTTLGDTVQMLRAAEKANAATATRRAEAEKAREGAEKAEADLAEAKQREKGWREAIEETMSEAFSVVTCYTNTVATDIMDGKLVAVNGDVGLLRGEAFVPFDLMAGLEQTMVLVGLQIGLQTGEKIVVLDELGRLTSDHKQTLARNLMHLIETSEIEQAILVDPNANDWVDHHCILIEKPAA